MKRVLIAPLDWGLGHAARCIPVIREFLKRKCEVFLAGSGDSLKLLQAEFNNLKAFHIPGYHPTYQRKGSMVWAMARQLPKFVRTIREEHEQIEKIVSENKIDLVISDNRYGAWTKSVPCIFITHQSNILMPKRFGWMAPLVRLQNERFMRRFTRCWIPDLPGKGGLAGELTNFGKLPSGISADFIGTLSRFVPTADRSIKYDVSAIFSGPEPQRALFENIVVPQLLASELNYFVVRGVVNGSENIQDNHADYLTSSALQEIIETSGVIIARSGYSTVMDMAALRKKVIFVPTPGQTEQEYLAQQLTEKGLAFSMNQQEFDLSVALNKIQTLKGFGNEFDHRTKLPEAVDKALRI